MNSTIVATTKMAQPSHFCLAHVQRKRNRFAVVMCQIRKLEVFRIGKGNDLAKLAPSEFSVPFESKRPQITVIVRKPFDEALRDFAQDNVWFNFFNITEVN